jgi:DNA-binding MarR family transcriptional regulator
MPSGEGACDACERQSSRRRSSNALVIVRGCVKDSGDGREGGTEGLTHRTVMNNVQYGCTVKLYICHYRIMRRVSQSSEQLVALAGELRGVFAKLKRRLQEQADAGDFTNTQKSVLLRLERDGPATVSMLARAEGVRPQSMRITVAALEAAGAVRGKPDPKDGRQTFLSLTPSFLKIVRTGRAAREDWLVRALQGQLAAREQEQLAAAVKLLGKLADF